MKSRRSGNTDEVGHVGDTPAAERISNEQRVRDGLEAWNRGDWDEAVAMLSPDVEWTIAQPLFDMPQVSHGHEGAMAFWRKWAEIWEHIHVELEHMEPFELEHMEPFGDGIAAFVRWRARGRDGVEVDQPVVFAFTIENGLTTRFTGYWDRDEAVEALGLQPPG
jgi:ketosteroid isomerase-like protein